MPRMATTVVQYVGSREKVGRNKPSAASCQGMPTTMSETRNNIHINEFSAR